jgi:hypothetical protein
MMTKAEKRAEAQAILDELKKLGIVAKLCKDLVIYEGKLPYGLYKRTLAVRREIAELLNNI